MKTKLKSRKVRSMDELVELEEKYGFPGVFGKSFLAAGGKPKYTENSEKIECLAYSIIFNPKFNLICYISPTLQYKEIRLLTQQPLPKMQIIKLKGIRARINKPGDYSIETKSIC